jgi:hypothetical protein
MRRDPRGETRDRTKPDAQQREGWHVYGSDAIQQSRVTMP